MVWIRLPGLLQGYYSDCLLKAISQTIGKVVKLDAHTDCARRGRFVHLAVCIDFRKPLVSKVRINGRLQRVEYEGLPTIYFKCGFNGHTVELCSRDVAMPPKSMNSVSSNMQASGIQRKVEG